MRPTAGTQHSNPAAAAGRRCVAIINPAGAAGRAGKLWDKLFPVVASQLGSHGYTVEQCFTSGTLTGTQLARQAAAAGVDVVLAVGGDGTIHEVASGLVEQAQQQQQQQRSDTALAVLPLGTGSDYARTFGWQPNGAQAACRRILSGEQQLVDVSVLRQAAPSGNHQPQQPEQQPTTAAAAAEAASTHRHAAAGTGGGERCYMVNVASCGAGALATARAAALKQLGPLAYSVAAALELLRWRGCTVQVCMDGSAEWQSLDRLTTLVVGHGRFWGGGLQILPEACPTDGLMDVVALQGLGLTDFILRGHLLRAGRHTAVKGVNVLGRCRRLQVRAVGKSPPVAWETDG